MKIRDDKGRVCEDPVIVKLLKLFRLYDDSEEGFTDDSWFFSEEEKAQLKKEYGLEVGQF